MVAGVSFRHLVQCLALHHVQRAQSLCDSTSRVEGVRISLKMTADDLEDVDATRKWIGDGPEAISREWFAVAVFASQSFSIRTTIDRLAPLSFVMRGIGSEFNQAIQQGAQADLSDTRDGEHRTQFALRDRIVDIRKNVFFVERALLEILFHQLIV